MTIQPCQLAYKSLELNVDAQNIKFVEGDNLKPILQNLYVPAPNGTKYGWKQQISLEQVSNGTTTELL